MAGSARRWFVAMGALLAGCGTTAPPAEERAPVEAAVPAPVPAPAPVPPPLVPDLALVPGAEHLYRQEMTIEVLPLGKTPTGHVRVQVWSDLRYRVGAVSDQGLALMEVRQERVRGDVSMESMGMKGSFDSATATADGADADPLGILRDVGTWVSWNLRRGEFPVKVEGDDSEDAEEPDGMEADEAEESDEVSDDEEGGDSGFPMDEMTVMPWLDFLPLEALGVGNRGTLDVGPAMEALANGGAAKAGYEVTAYDPGTGIASIVVALAAQEPGKEGTAPGGLRTPSLRIEDRFDARHGWYLSRHFVLQGDSEGPDEDVTVVEGERGIRLRVEIRMERVEAFEPPAPTPAK